MGEIESSAPQSRGPADHSVRDQIVAAAEEHFSHYGFEKTTVSDLAKAIGFSLLFWFYFSLIYDGLILYVIYSFSDYPLEKVTLSLVSLNPVDLARRPSHPPVLRPDVANTIQTQPAKRHLQNAVARRSAVSVGHYDQRRCRCRA